MPRKSTATQNILPLHLNGRPTRLQPPADLAPSERTRFNELIRACAANHFRTSDLPLICEFIRTSILCERAAVALRDSSPVLPNNKLSPWFGIWTRAQRSLMVLSTRLRLNPQARLHQQHVARQNLRPPSAYEVSDDDASGR